MELGTAHSDTNCSDACLASANDGRKVTLPRNAHIGDLKATRAKSPDLGS